MSDVVLGAPPADPAGSATPAGLWPVRTRTRTRSRGPGRLLVAAAAAWLGLLLAAVLLADVLPLHAPDTPVTGLRPRTPPGLRWPEPLGTDVAGRSMLSRLVYGGRNSLLIGVVAVVVAMAAGLLLGMAAGYLRGVVDAVLRVLLDTSLAVPPLVLLLAVAALGRRTVWTVALSLALVGTPAFARLARARTLALADRDHVVAARAMGAGRLRIAAEELLPPVLVSLSTYAVLFLGTMVVAEGSLAFLGLGLPPPSPSWGRMVDEGRRYFATQPWLVFVPAACLVLTVVSCAVLSDRLRTGPGTEVPR